MSRVFRYNKNINRYEEIQDNEFEQIRLIDLEKNLIGIMSSAEALKLSDEKELDIVIIDNKVNPAVGILCDARKYFYSQEKEAKKKVVPSVKMKEIDLMYGIDKNDLKRKTNDITKFLSEGDKVTIKLRVRKRDSSKLELASILLKNLVEELSSVGKIEKDISNNNLSFSVVLLPVKKK